MKKNHCARHCRKAAGSALTVFFFDAHLFCRFDLAERGVGGIAGPARPPPRHPSSAILRRGRSGQPGLGLSNSVLVTGCTIAVSLILTVLLSYGLCKLFQTRVGFVFTPLLCWAWSSHRWGIST